MARYVKPRPIRDHLPEILAGVISALLVAFIIWAAPRAVPAVKGFLSDAEDPPVESVTPEQEEAPAEEPPEEASPEEEGGEAQKLGDRLLAACKKFWPVLPVFIVVMEAVEYVGKLFGWIRKRIR